ncbi:putative membrane protein [Bacillus mesophilus]|uniref:Uncharacterized protein n=1 Tax=Bacillus mesophilus TaxID=1808955 RepID=A0A6M0Q4V3_9BACI|nr:hypothetical protein [Bacillus mesophilus]MBM7661046.1 putative membrane protein [Bacillus mesophilus]NEY71416.1 hypothetical protein [Bacillus mesophilus]
MKSFAWVLAVFYSFITILWIANSPYLFSLWGLIIWLVSIVLGVFVYKKLKEGYILRKFILYSSFFMVFLIVLTAFIHLATSSMP